MQVRVQNEEMFEKRFLKAAKKAKLNYEFKEFYNDTITVMLNSEPVKVQRHFKIYEVEDLPPSDWEMVKRFDHENRVILSFGEEGHNELLNECRCEACGVNHKRVFTYLLRNKKNPLNFIQVGRSCLSKYIPNSPKFSYDDYLEFLDIDFQELDDVRGCRLTATDELPAKEILIEAVAGFEFFGRDYDEFKANYDFRFGVPCSKEAKEKAEEEAEVLLDWILNHNPQNSEYLDKEPSQNKMQFFETYSERDLTQIQT